MSGDRVTKHRKNTEKLKIEQRRRTVAVNLLAGATYREIAAALGVSKGTIARDVKFITKEWKAHYTTQFDSFRELQMQRLDVLFNAVWAKATQGDSLAHIDRALAIMDRMNQMSALAKLDKDPGDGNTMITIVEVRKPTLPNAG